MAADQMKLTVTYENPEGEVKQLTTSVTVTTGESRQKVVLDIIRNGFRIEDKQHRGIFHHIPPGRVLMVTYAE